MAYGFERAHGQGESMGEGGFPFPVIFIPLTVGLLIHFARRKRHHMRMMYREGWKNGVPPLFNEWHRRAHEAEAQESKAPETKAQEA